MQVKNLGIKIDSSRSSTNRPNGCQVHCHVGVMWGQGVVAYVPTFVIGGWLGLQRVAFCLSCGTEALNVHGKYETSFISILYGFFVMGQYPGDCLDLG